MMAGGKGPTINALPNGRYGGFQQTKTACY